MVNIRSKFLHGSVLVSFVFLFSACSKKATCALEGCTDSKVSLQSDKQASQDARPDEFAAAKAEIEKAKKALEESFKELKDRVIFNESVDKIQNDMLSIHETRIAALELKAGDLADDIVGLKNRMTAVEAEIGKVRGEISDLETALRAAIAEGDTATASSLQSQIDTLTTNLGNLQADYDSRLVALEKLTNLDNGTLVNLINSEITKVQGDVTKLIQALYGSSGALPDDMPEAGVLERLQLVEQGTAAAQAGLLNLFHLVVKVSTELGAIVDFNGTLDASKWNVELKRISDMEAEIDALQAVVGDAESGLVKAVELLQAEVDGIHRCTVSAEYVDGKILFAKIYKKDITCGPENGPTSTATVIVRIK